MHAEILSLSRNSLITLLLCFFPAILYLYISFSCPYYEDSAVVRALQQRFPTYAGNFPVWSEHTSAMHQLALWTLLEEAGFGASLQHYNPLIDKDVRAQWRLPEEWRLIAQMPFGLPLAPPAEKTFEPVEARMRIFR